MFDFRWVRLSSITEPNRRQSNDWSSIGFDYRTFHWPRRAQGTHALICKLQMEIKWEIKTYLWNLQFSNLLRSRVKLKLLYDAKTNQLRCLCQRFVRKFHNALFWVYLFVEGRGFHVEGNFFFNFFINKMWCCCCCSFIKIVRGHSNSLNIKEPSPFLWR